MIEDEQRPSPDTVLARITADDARAKRAKLKIFFGFAPGVGKTYRMLQVARDLVVEHQADILVGLVETHRRRETAAMLLGLDILPKKKVAYRGHNLEEFDLEAALARKPAVILLDELAHTNAPGSLHEKRWQDVLELLDAGIDVLTTVNVQHVESLNDVIEQITGVRVRETIPDSILERADDIEVVDIAPEELLARLREGKVYVAEQAARATQNFFRRGNLLALRELALRCAAQRVDQDVRDYRAEHGVAQPWAVSERILVCISPAPSSARLLRAASRMAAGLHGQLLAVCVEATSLGGFSHDDQQRIESHVRLAEALGANVVRVSGNDLVKTILAHAHEVNATRIVLGKPGRARWRDRLRSSLLQRLVAQSGDIDVHVIRGDAAEDLPAATPSPTVDAAHTKSFNAYVAALLLVVIATVIARGARSVLPVPDLEMLYLLAVMFAALRYGRGPAIAAAAAAVLAYDFFLVPPYLTFAVADARYILTFAMMFGVGILVSELTTRLRSAERFAVTREQRTAALYSLSRTLAEQDDAPAIATAVARHAAEEFKGSAAVGLIVDGQVGAWAASPIDASLAHDHRSLANWVAAQGRLAGLGTDTLPGVGAIGAPLQVRDTTLGTLLVVPRDGAPLLTEQKLFMEAFCRQAAFAIERVRLTQAAQAAAVRIQTEEMRNSLLSAVSHDLRTPLAAITGAATTLRERSDLPAATRSELLGAVCDEAERLERLVGDLLDMTRVESGGLHLRREIVPMEEMIGSAVGRLETRLGTRKVTVKSASQLSLVYVDAVLFEQVFVNLLENAAKYAPVDAHIEIATSHVGDQVVVTFDDDGPGFVPGTEEKIFDKFYRGVHPGVGGVGLGLAICRGILIAHGGTLTASNRPSGGARFIVQLKAASLPAQGSAT